MDLSLKGEDEVAESCFVSCFCLSSTTEEVPKAGVDELPNRLELLPVSWVGFC